MNKRNSLVWQAALRLVLSLGLFVLLIALATTLTYRTTMERAAEERAGELVAFFKSRLAQLEREWELASRDLRVRIEYTRFLEQPATARSNLQAFITTQGADRRFQYLIVQSREGQKLFSFGKDLALATIPLGRDQNDGLYFDRAEGRLYRVFQDNIWLGEQAGMGRFAVFYLIDNAQLRQLSAPGITLTLLNSGEPVASSGGQDAIDRLRRGVPAEASAIRVMPWTAEEKDGLQLHMNAPVRPLFSAGQLITAMSAIPVLDALILWFSIGMWLIWQTRRVTALRRVVDEIADSSRITASVEAGLERAAGNRNDEIAEVAQAIRTMTTEIVTREDINTKLILHLQESSEQLKAILESVGDGISGIDRQGRITFINRAGAGMLGWQPEDLIGKDQHRFIHHSRPDGGPYPGEECPILETMRERSAIGHHYADDVFWCRDGRSFPVEFATMPIESNGGVAGAVIVFRDISERIAHEDELKLARQTAEDSNLAKSQFLATMSHELRTPLNTILGFSEVMLSQNWDDEPQPRTIEYLSDIHASASHLLEVINDVLDISKIEAGRVEIAPIRLPTAEVLQRVSRLLAERAHKNRLTLEVAIPPDIPDLWADERALKQILFNLIANAIKFTPAGGTITLRAAARNESIEISVTDTGIGIPAEHLERVQKPFEQLDNRYSRSAGGTGLGLSVVIGLVKLHSGRLSIISEPGKGSAFTVHLPLPDKAREG